MTKDAPSEYYNTFFNKKEYSYASLKKEEKRRWNQLKSVLDNKNLVTAAVSGAKIKILDFGCGDGRFYPLFSLYGDVEGIDYANEAVQRGNKNLGINKFIVGNLTDPDLPKKVNKRYDLIISTEVIEHIDTAQQAYYFINLFTLLSKNGKALITTPNGKIKKHHFSGDRIKWKQPLENWLTRNQLHQYLKDVGFKISYSSTFYQDWIIERHPKTWLYIFFNRYTVGLMRLIGLNLLIRKIFKKIQLGFYQILIVEKNTSDDE